MGLDDARLGQIKTNNNNNLNMVINDSVVTSPDSVWRMVCSRPVARMLEHVEPTPFHRYGIRMACRYHQNLTVLAPGCVGMTSQEPCCSSPRGSSSSCSKGFGIIAWPSPLDRDGGMTWMALAMMVGCHGLCSSGLLGAPLRARWIVHSRNHSHHVVMLICAQ